MAEKSAIKLIKGNDALFEYKSQSWNAKTYVERNGLIYKSLIDTSPTFVSNEWELVNDLREVRVSNITNRNALTGSTPTSGTTGIKIPILDNTNVLVLDAFSDIGKHQFARYNWNATTHTWLLLQSGTGSTSGGTIGDYTTLINKPLIISGITANAGAGLTGGGVFSGAVPPNRATFTFSHSDTSSLANTSNTGYTYLQNFKVDTFGHLTGATSSLWVHPDTSSQVSVSNSPYTYIKDITLDGSGHLTAIGSSTWVHPDTSSQASSNNTGNNYIQSIFLDSNGHVTGITTNTVSVSGGGVNFNVGGNTGSVVAMPNNGNLRITGGTNIQTVSSLNGTNVGVRINVVPSGSDSQLQLNTSGVLGTASLLTFTGGTTLNTGLIKLTNSPSVNGNINDNILVRNITTGRIDTITNNTLSSLLAALPVNAVQYRTANGFGGDAKWIFVPATKSLTLGTRSGSVGSGSTTLGFANVASGLLSHAEGTLTTASGANSHAEGTSTTASNTNSHAEGTSTTASGAQAHAEGNANVASGTNSHAEGQQNTASGQNSHAGGNVTQATNTNTFASGKGFGGGKDIFASGVGAFIHSTNDVNQTVGHGALGTQSAILGGLNHNIAATAPNAAIIGGSGIKLSTSTYSGITAVAGLAIFATPAAGGGDDLLTWNATDKKINKITQSSLTGIAAPAGANGYIQFRNNSGLFGAAAGLTYLTGTSFLVSTNLRLTTAPAVGTLSDNILVRNTGTGNIETTPTSGITKILVAGNGINKQGNIFRLGGGLTGNTTISGASFTLNLTNRALTLGTRSGTTALYTMSIGVDNLTNVPYALAVGNRVKASGQGTIASGILTIASGAYSNAHGNLTIASGVESNAHGNLTIASGSQSHSGGLGFSVTKEVIASGIASFNNSRNTTSQVAGHGALADNSAILGGLDHNIEVGNINAAIIGGSGIKLTAAGSYSNFVAVPNLAIFTAPAAGGADDVLTWNAASKKIGKVTQASISDERLKKNLIPLNNILNTIDMLSTFEFQYNEKNRSDIVDTFDYGLIAQEVEKVFPHVVKDNLTIDGDSEKYKTVDYKKLVPVLFAAIKELNTKISDLNTKIDQLSDKK